MSQHQHKWSEWVMKEQFVQYSDGMYRETWNERWCFTCGATERTGYTRTKVRTG